jgi:murein DD-endopeptidase MepM/ murein hydrolase activator NlpD
MLLLFLKTLIKRYGSELKLLYTGAGLLTVATLLMLTVLLGVNYPHAQVRPQVPTTQSQSTAQRFAVSKQAQGKVRQVTATPTPTSDKDDAVVAALLARKTLLGFGWQLYPVYQDWRFHTGVDISAKAGEPVKAICAGTVKAIGKDGETGLTVEIQGEKYTLFYGSLASVQIAKGMRVRAGQEIGTAGQCDAEPYIHIHIAVKSKDKFIDPKTIF